MIGGVQNIGRITELRQRILFTFAMLAVYRIGAFIVTPGIDPEVVKSFFQQMAGTVFGLFSLFSGGALEQLSIFSLGIMPYISASIIFQLLTVVIPKLEELKKEGASGQKKINQYTRYATIGLAMFQGFLISVALENGQFGEGAVSNPGLSYKLMCMITLTSGTAFIMWLGEQITERGIGNGISMIIFASIIISIPSALGRVFQLIRTDQFSILQTLFIGAFAVGLVFFVVLVERGQRRIPIQHARRVVGRRVKQGGMSDFPQPDNTPGVIPANETPGTPSISGGSKNPCQWIDVSSDNSFRTWRIAISPSRKRSSGPGTVPLIAVARARSSPMRMVASPMVRSNFLLVSP